MNKKLWFCIVFSLTSLLYSNNFELLFHDYSLNVGEITFEHLGKNYYLSFEGQLISEDNSFSLPFANHEWFERVYFSSYKDYILLAFEIHNGDAGYANFYKIGLSGKILVDLIVGGFNLGIPYLDESSVYFASIGSIAKVDLEKNKLSWIVTDLYKKYNANTPWKIIPEERHIKVTYSSERQVIIIDKDSGSIIDQYYE
ncbi:MAG: hypothetical protein JEZ03_18315 [Bacteroidales bacterium]|nr:hypothetical protein [Bacteroidales bacterium]